jgi:hypothetical protein
MTHAWCHDIERDAAVRAAEDNRTEPLPTLGKAIAAPFACTACGGFGMDHRCKESCDECEWTPQTSDGMRTERITLEVTHDLDARLSDWIVDRPRLPSAGLAMSEQGDGRTHGAR